MQPTIGEAIAISTLAIAVVIAVSTLFMCHIFKNQHPNLPAAPEPPVNPKEAIGSVERLVADEFRNSNNPRLHREVLCAILEKLE